MKIKSISFDFRLLLGLTEKLRELEFEVLGTTWGYDQAMLFKCDECYLEAGLQVILQTFIQMTKSWKLYEHALLNPQEKGYYIPGEEAETSSDVISEGKKGLSRIQYYFHQK